MWNCSYHVMMQTSIGIRYGIMSVIIEHSKIEGILDILKKANPFHGKINEKGDCQIQGELTTLMRTIPYHATGRITKEAVLLKLMGEQERFEISGSASAHLPVVEKEQTL